MKRLISLGIALLLLLSAVCCASAEGKTFKTPYFTITLPEGWDIDTTPLDEDETEEGIVYLGIFADTKRVGLEAIAYLVYYEDLKDFSLWNADEEDLELYTDFLMDVYEEDRPKYLGIIKAHSSITMSDGTVRTSSIPFVLIKGMDEDGEYLCADTITNGYAIEIKAIVVDEGWENQYSMTEKYIEQFKSVLSTFQPVP